MDYETETAMGVAHSSQAGGGELAPDDITAVNRPVYMLVIAGLVVALIFGLVAWFVLAMRGEQMPAGMAAVIGTVGGGLVGLLAGSKK
jgi:hypothetical protein